MKHESKEVKNVKEEKINRGHHTYQQYLEEQYGRSKTKKMKEARHRM